jgi:indole-3-glycerol phosphate synthase
VTILDTILADKRVEVAELQKRVPLRELTDKALHTQRPRGFKRALEQKSFALIAEIKKASPSRGTLVENFDHRKLAEEFEKGGASALSVLTDRKYFSGDPAFIRHVKEAVGLPVLRKDFIVDEYQVYESRALGADAILLIVRALSAQMLMNLMKCAVSLGMDVLVETHTEEEIHAAHAAGAGIVGINNRDLSTFQASLDTSFRLRKFVAPESLAVSESGIHTRSDMTALRDAGFHAALIGEGLVTSADRVSAVRELMPA